MKLSEYSQEGKFKRLLPSLNTEPKNITWYCLGSNLQTQGNLQKEFKRNIEEEEAIVPDPNTLKDYCRWTFNPIGLVAEEKIIPQGWTTPVSHWRLTEDGKKYKPLAALAIKTANEFGMSMYQVLGSTFSKTESRAPYNRAKILMELAEEENLRAIDLKKEIGLNSREDIRSGILNLKNIGFVHYESISSEEKDWSKYKWTGKDEEVKTVSTYPALTREVSEILYKSSRPLDRNEISKKLNHKHPTVVSKILSSLEKQGFCERSKFKTGEKLSEASITETGLKFLREFLEPTYEALEDEKILEDIKKEILDEYENDPVSRINDFTDATKLYADVSPAFKKEPREVMKGKILDVLEENSLRPKEIDRLIGKYVQHILKDLIEEGKITKKREGKAVYYQLK